MAKTCRTNVTEYSWKAHVLPVLIISSKKFELSDVTLSHLRRCNGSRSHIIPYHLISKTLYRI